MTESTEMYLKHLYLLKLEQDVVRAIDLAKRMDFSKASISRALTNLKNENLILINENGAIEFSETGHKKASEIYMRCFIIKQFLSKVLGLNNSESCTNACQIEHVITDSCYKRIQEYLKKDEDKC